MRLSLISDTHSFHEKIILPSSDVIIHSGDFSNSRNLTNSINESERFLRWYAKQKADYKILVAGNHDFSIYRKNDQIIQLIEDFNIIYLEDSSVTIDNIVFYGTPWVPTFFNWAFMKQDRDLKSIFDSIDPDTNFLISHGPPHSILDTTPYEKHVGSKALLESVRNLKHLKYHAFGHIHESAGSLERYGVNFINASSLISKKPTLIEI